MSQENETEEIQETILQPIKRRKNPNIIESDISENESSETPFDENFNQLPNGIFSVKSLKKKSDSEVWKYFGILCCDSSEVLKFRKRIFCRLCSEMKPRVYKRYSFIKTNKSIICYLYFIQCSHQ